MNLKNDRCRSPIRLEMKNLSELEGLMTPEKYRQYLESQTDDIH
jgi:hypothetical protein